MEREADRVVVKVGTNTLTDDEGRPDGAYLADLAEQIVELREAGRDVILVSSGAIGSGLGIVGVDNHVEEIRLRQAVAAVGQPHLMRAWDEAFREHGVRVAQLLLTHGDFTNRSAYLNLRNTMEKLLDLGVVPVVNENDTTSVDEIDESFGDNDRLSAYMAAKSEADLLVLLTDVDGLYTGPPSEPEAERIPVVDEVTDEIRAVAGEGSASSPGRGGMRSKVEAAEIATAAGVPVVVARGREDGILDRVLAGEDVGTRFPPSEGERGKESWLRIAHPEGRVRVDAGAVEALRDGRHLLPAGVTGVEGVFGEGDVVAIVHDGDVVAKARSTYRSRDLDRVRGMHSEEIRETLDRQGQANVTRKGDLVVFKDGERPTV
jgi:glutamate 5-kinase